MNAIAASHPPAAWPDCRDDMHTAARRLLDAGMTGDEAACSLRHDFGAGLPGKWSEEVRMTLCRSVIAEEAMRLGNARALIHRQSDPVRMPMSPGLLAFAEARGLVCGYCGRVGTRAGDPDGHAWHRDSVPRGLQTNGRDLELACSACKTDPDRFARLGDALEGY
jgi:hypothetical protein